MAKIIVNGMDNYPAPPPPPPPTSKNPHKTLVVALLIVLLVVTSIFLAYLAFGNKGGSSLSDNTNATPSVSGTLPTGILPTGTPSASVTLPTSTASALSTGTPPASTSSPDQPFNIDTAQSLQFTVTYKAPGVAGQEIFTYTWSAKNIGTSSMMMRIEGKFFQTQAFFNKTYIVNGAQQKAWFREWGEWTDVSDEFSVQWSTWNETWQGYRENLLGWDGLEDLYYTLPNGDIVHIYKISVNPDLPDSLFQQ